ncbi:MAG: AI-2E family transporter [Bacteroidia bacterium]|nr:AI-2E family transporter [Bacteroidia bacterium]MDW8348068.1 AI-2E family transporter [Bacteroidia bacterium]
MDVIKNALRYFYIALVTAIIISVIIYFHVIFQYLLVAFLLTYILHPLVDYISEIHIYNTRIGRSIAIFISFSLIICFLASLFLLLIPIVTHQLENFGRVNSKALVKLVQEPLVEVEKFAIRNKITRQKGFLVDFVEKKINNFITSDEIQKIAAKLATTTLDILLYLFVVPIITFFMLHDSRKIKRALLDFVPNRYFEIVINAINKSELLLRRYLYGLFLQSLSVTLMSFIVCTIFGLRDALIIAIFFGVFNVIPYLGMIMTGLFALLLNVGSQITEIVANHDTHLLNLIFIKVVFSIGIVHFVDANITQPLIFSKSVNAHPLEIFIVILAGAFVAGIIGMAVCVPVYMISKILIREFFWAYKNYAVFRLKN